MAIKISNNTIIDDNRNIVDAGIATAILFDGYIDGDDKQYTANTTLNNNKSNVSLEGDITVAAGVTLTVSTGSTIVLNPLDFENSLLDQLIVNNTIKVGGIVSSFFSESTGIGSVGINTTRIIGIGINTNNNISIGQLVKPIPYIIGSGTTITGIAGTPGSGVVIINPPTLNTVIIENQKFDFGFYEKTKSKFIIDGEEGIIYNANGFPILCQSGSVLQTAYNITDNSVSNATNNYIPSNLNCSITVRSQNSIILVMVTQHFYNNATSSSDASIRVILTASANGIIELSNNGVGHQINSSHTTNIAKDYLTIIHPHKHGLPPGSDIQYGTLFRRVSTGTAQANLDPSFIFLMEIAT